MSASVTGEKVLLIANPSAQSGKGAIAANFAADVLERSLAESAVGSYLAGAQLEVQFTKSAGDAYHFAFAAGGYRAVVALGGDGVIHDAVNGLMHLEAFDRPAFGVIPSGTGNDYARALGVPLGTAEAVQVLLQARAPRAVDVGSCNGVYFAETLSFGLDAAIALDTMERRARTGQTGAKVFVASGIDQVLNHLRAYKYTGTFDDQSVQGQSITFAVQVGPYYGGGFRICPDAQIDDGYFDICIAHPPVGPTRALYIFLRAKNAHHTKFRQIELRRAKSLSLHFDEQPCVQIDGEPLVANSYEVRIHPYELQVLAPPMRGSTSR